MLSKVLLRDPVIERAFQRGQRFFVEHDTDLQAHRTNVSNRLRVALREFRLSLDPGSLSSASLHQLVSDTCEYVQWLQWSLDDVGFFCVACGLDRDTMARRIVACHFVYQAGRMFDDVLDNHSTYKGLRETVLGARHRPRLSLDTSQAKNEVMLSALSLLLRGIADYSTCFGTTVPVAAIRELVATANKACLGALIELDVSFARNHNSYAELIALKSAAHNAILLRPFHGLLSDGLQAELDHFYTQTSLLGQMLNDGVDMSEDQKLGQYNYYNDNGIRADYKLRRHEVEELSTLLRDLARSISDFSSVLHAPCFAKFSTFIHKLAEISA